MSEEKMKFAIIQMSMKMGDKEANVSKAEKMIDEAVEKYKPDIIGLPELFNTEYFPLWFDRKYFMYAEPIPGPTINRMIKKAQQHGIYIIAPIYEEVAKGEYYDTAVMIAPDGKILGAYRKVHVPMGKAPELGVPACYEKFYFRGGTEFPVFETKLGTIGICICWDSGFVESWRILTLRGADVVFVPEASQGKFFAEMDPIVGRVMAQLNECYAVVVNRVGTEGEAWFYGRSQIASPTGEILAGPASDKEEILCATLDLEIIRELRSLSTFLRDRKPEFYGPLTELLPLKERRIREKSEYGRVK